MVVTVVTFSPLRLLVGADGAMSAVRRICGIATWGWGYGQEAVVATVKLRDYLPPSTGADESASESQSATEEGSARDSRRRSRSLVNDTAWQRYLPTGPLALLPLWDGYCSIVWSTGVSEVRRLKALSSEAFLAELNAAL